MKTKDKKQKSEPHMVKLGVSRQIAIPKKMYKRLKLTTGDYFEAEISGDSIVLTPKVFIEKRLAEGLKDIKDGKVDGPFATASDLVKSLKK